MAIILFVALNVINAGYGAEGSFEPLGGFRFVSRTLGGPRSLVDGNRFTATWLENIPVPLPRNYVIGIDVQRSDFERRMSSYLRGQWKDGGWWYYYLYALAIKEPLGTWSLLALSIGLGLFAGARKLPSPRPLPVDGEGFATGDYAASWRDELILLAPAIVVLALVSSQTGFNHHVRYVLPCLPFLFISISKVARCIEFKQWKIAALASGLLIWSVGSSLYYYPHSLSYFNELAGGPRAGHFHLGNSNVDWGQDLLYLKQWYNAHPEARPLHLAYDMPLISPKTAAGIDWVRVPAGPVMNRPRAPVTRDWPWSREAADSDADEAIESMLPAEGDRPVAGPVPGWFIVSVNQIHRRRGDFEYFLEFDPVDSIGYTMNVYNITRDDANRVRRKLGLAELAAQ